MKKYGSLLMLALMIAAVASAHCGEETTALTRLREVAAIAAEDSVGRVEAIARLVKETSKDGSESGRDALIKLSESAEALWYDTESAEADETLYGMWARAIVASPILSDMEKVRPLSQLDDISKNAVGRQATDVEVECADGRNVSLMSLLAKDGNTLIVFYDPDCDHCDEVIERLDREGYTEANRIITVCVEGDAERWHERILTMPTEWTNVYGAAALGLDAEEEIYVLRSMPTLYLISPEEIVLAKNIRL